MKKIVIIIFICAAVLALAYFSFSRIYLHHRSKSETALAGDSSSGKEAYDGAAASARKRDAESKIHRTGLKLLLIGLDAADWQIIDPLMAKGRLPNLQRLINNGVRADLRSIDPMMSPMLWTTLATGKTPDLHGIADFLVYDPNLKRKIPITSNFRKSKALWNILSDFDIPSAFIAWWATFPAEQIKGIMVSELLAHSVLYFSHGNIRPSGITCPQEFYDEVRPKLLTLEDISYANVKRFIDITPEEFEEGKKECEKPPEKDEEGNPIPVQNPAAMMIKALLATTNYQRVALDVLDRRDLDLISVYFEGIDIVGHRFQHLMPPKMKIVSEEEYKKYNKAVTEFYAFQDELLGDMIKKVGNDAVIMVISDHGFRNGSDRPEDILPYTTNQPVEWHREYGIFILSGPSTSRGNIGKISLFDVFPTILAILGLPEPSDIQGKVIERAFASDFFRRFPPMTIASYEGIGERPATAQVQIPSEAQEAMLENLRALGYIGADDTKSSGASSVSPSSPEQISKELDTNATYHRNLATFFMKQGDLKKAEEQLLLALSKKKLPKTYEMLAEIFAQQDRTDDAIGKIEEGMSEFPNLGDEDVLWIVELRLRQGNVQEAYASLEKWKKRIKKNAVMSACLGRIAEAQGNIAEAERYYRTSIDQDPLLVSTALKLFYILDSRGKGFEIERYVRRGLEKSDRIDEYHNLMGLLLKRKGDILGAIGEFQKALEIYPESDIFLFNLGSAYMASGDWNDARTTLERAASLGSGNPSLWINLGTTYFQNGDLAKSLDAYQRAINFGAPGSSAYYGLALAYHRLNKIDEAIKAAQDGLSVNPADKDLKKLYSTLLGSRGSSSQ